MIMTSEKLICLVIIEMQFVNQQLKIDAILNLQAAWEI